MIYYDITIANTGLLNSGDSVGFIDRRTSYNYMDVDDDAPDNVGAALAKARANRRFKNVIMSLDFMTNCYIVNYVATGEDADTAPTSLKITIHVEHGDSALSTVAAAGEPQAGQTLTGIAAIKRCVARAMMIEETRNMEWYDPTPNPYQTKINGADRTGSQIMPIGTVINKLVIGKLAATLAECEAAVTVVGVS